jgi:formyltetrahydrofolate deformylase
MSHPGTARLLIRSPDQPGLIAAVTSFIGAQGANIVRADQHTDPDESAFFMRVEIARDTLPDDREAFERAFHAVAEPLQMTWRLEWGDRPKRMAILVSKQDHCLNDLMYRWRTRELRVELPLVISNHDAARQQVELLGVPFHHLPITPETKPEQEARIAELLDANDIDFVVLARYMQILSPQFARARQGRVINIHHSFLPAFPGAQPYQRAHARGVKLIGATSHYVTEDLDEGPIIDQQTTHVDHRDSVADLVRTGRDLERVVLARAVRLHAEDLVLISGNRTVVFD